MPDDLSYLNAQIQKRLAEMKLCTECVRSKAKCTCAHRSLRKQVVGVNTAKATVFPEVSVVNVPKCVNCDTPDKRESIPCSSCGVL